MTKPFNDETGRTLLPPDKESPPKSPYSKPKLTEHGTLRELTHGGSGLDTEDAGLDPDEHP